MADLDDMIDGVGLSHWFRRGCEEAASNGIGYLGCIVPIPVPIRNLSNQTVRGGEA